jgi:Ca-activated chloride channel family protein
MNDELESLKILARQEQPLPPRPEARRRAIAEAMLRFEAIGSASRQGSSFSERLRGAASAALFGRPSMKLSFALAGGASLAVLALALINTAQLANVPAPPQSPADATSAGAQQLSRIPAPVASSSVTASRRKAAEVDESRLAAPEAEIASTLPSTGGGDAVAREERGSAVFESSVMSQLPATGVAPTAEADSRSALTGGVGSVRNELGQYRSFDGDGLAEVRQFHREQGRDRFRDIEPNQVKIAADEPVSTFSIDVDTASYAFLRASLNNNLLPQKDAVRVEELVNYFPYDYPGPADRAEPFRASVSVFPTPWNADTRLMHVGIRGFTLDGEERRRANLVFLIDTSGSMDEPNKLPLLQNALKMLVETLKPDDSVAIVAYAGNAGTVLEPTRATEKGRILAALDNLRAGGSTAGGEGIRQAYELAQRSFDPEGINRVILATDGDFNVGIAEPDELKSFVERKRETGVYLSVLGFGMGNYNDELMQALAQNGNGNAQYIDNLNEARKALVDGAGAMLFPIARDVKVQVEFNPAAISEYRLIGYETRRLNREDFNNDKVDAGEIGAGHTVTALYEITPKGSKGERNDPLRYTSEPEVRGSADELAFLKIRYKLPGSDVSTLLNTPVRSSMAVSSIGEASEDARFATAVAAFGEVLRGGRYTGSFGYDDVIALAQGARGGDPFGYRTEFINLVRLAKTAQPVEPLKQ